MGHWSIPLKNPLFLRSAPAPSAAMSRDVAAGMRFIQMEVAQLLSFMDEPL
jgi:hypothetical protein